jgi:hypothetical protein
MDSPGRKRGVVSRVELIQILREAHAHCKKTVAYRSHTTPSGRTRFSRPAQEYRDCIRRYIQEKIKEIAKQRGYVVA